MDHIYKGTQITPILDVRATDLIYHQIVGINDSGFGLQRKLQLHCSNTNDGEADLTHTLEGFAASKFLDDMNKGSADLIGLVITTYENQKLAPEDRVIGVQPNKGLTPENVKVGRTFSF